MKKHQLVWTNFDLDYDRDWKDYLEDAYPDLSEDERIDRMYECNGERLEDERANLNIQLDQPILVVADLGLWNGRRMGYREIRSGNIRDCLYAGKDDLYVTWFVDERGDLRCEAIHHDGTNYLTYRAYKPGATERKKEALRAKLYAGIATRRDITRVTNRLGDLIAEVYGWEIPRQRGRAVA